MKSFPILLWKFTFGGMSREIHLFFYVMIGLPVLEIIDKLLGIENGLGFSLPFLLHQMAYILFGAFALIVSGYFQKSNPNTTN